MKTKLSIWVYLFCGFRIIALLAAFPSLFNLLHAAFSAPESLTAFSVFVICCSVLDFVLNIAVLFFIESRNRYFRHVLIADLVINSMLLLSLFALGSRSALPLLGSMLVPSAFLVYSFISRKMAIAFPKSHQENADPLNVRSKSSANASPDPAAELLQTLQNDAVSFGNTLEKHCVSHDLPISPEKQEILFPCFLIAAVIVPLDDDSLSDHILSRAPYDQEKTKNHFSALMDALKSSEQYDPDSFLSNPLYSLSKCCLSLLQLPASLDFIDLLMSQYKIVCAHTLPLLQAIEVKKVSANSDDTCAEVARKDAETAVFSSIPAETLKKLKRYKIWAVASSVLCAFFFVYTLVVQIQYLSDQEAIKQYEAEVARLQRNDTSLTNSLKDRDNLIKRFKEKNKVLQDKANILDEHIAFIVDDGSYAYHSYDCSVIKEYDMCWIYTIDEAIANGYYPCRFCH